MHGLFGCGLRAPFRAALEAVGSEGSVFVDDPWLCSRPGIELRRGRDVAERIAVAEADSYLRGRPGQGLSFEVSTTRKSEPFKRWSVCSWSFDQRGSGTPEMYQLEPLSATIIP